MTTSHQAGFVIPVLWSRSRNQTNSLCGMIIIFRGLILVQLLVHGICPIARYSKNEIMLTRCLCTDIWRKPKLLPRSIFPACGKVFLMRGSRTFCQRGSNFDNVFFLVDEGRKDPNTTINGPSSARQRNAI